MKLVALDCDKAGAGRPFTGAWIETGIAKHDLCGRQSPLHGGVD